MKKLSCALVLGSILWTAGCVAPRHVVHHGKHTHVVVHDSHVHTDRCGHYRQGRRWYFSKGHRHRAGCGHVFVGGHWVLK